MVRSTTTIDPGRNPIRRTAILALTRSRVVADGWRIWQSDKGRWWAQRRADWKGHELYEHADADSLVKLFAKLAGITYCKPKFTVHE